MPKFFLLLFLVAIVFVAQAQDTNALAQAEVEGDTLMSRQDFAGAIKIYSKVIAEAGLKEKSMSR